MANRDYDTLDYMQWRDAVGDHLYEGMTLKDAIYTDEVTIVRLALGDWIAAASEWTDDNAPLDMDLAVLKFCLEIMHYPGLQKTAEHIVLRNAARMAGGEPIDDRMRKLIISWPNNLLPKNSGRKSDGRLKQLAVYVSFSRRMKRNSTSPRKLPKKAIIADVAKEFGIGRRQVLNLLKLRSRLVQSID